MSDPGQHITVQCACGKRLKAPLSAGGRRAKCPGCGALLVVGDAAEAVSSMDERALSLLTTESPALGMHVSSARTGAHAPHVASPMPAAVWEELNQSAEIEDAVIDAYDLADDAAPSGGRAAASDAPTRCPNCARQMLGGDFVCANCGFDTRQGMVVAASTVVPPTRRPLSWPGLGRKGENRSFDRMAPLGSLRVGIISSLVAAIVASVLWILIAYFFGRDVYWLELLVGLGAGLGMRIGQRGFSKTGGIAAAAVTAGVLLAARVMVGVAVIAPLAAAERKAASAAAAEASAQAATSPTSAPSSAPTPATSTAAATVRRDPRVADYIAEQELEARQIDSDSKGYYEAMTEARTRAAETLKAIPPQEYDALLPRAEQHAIRTALVEAQMDQELRSMGLNPDFQRIEPENFAKARRNITERVRKLTPAQQKADLKKLDWQALEELEESIAISRDAARGIPPYPGTIGSPPGTRGGTAPVASAADDEDGAGFSTMFFLIFRPLAVLFTLFSMAAAYKTAAGSMTG